MTKLRAKDIAELYYDGSVPALDEAIRRGSFPPPDYRLGKLRFWHQSTVDRIEQCGGYANGDYLNSQTSAA